MPRASRWLVVVAASFALLAVAWTPASRHVRAAQVLQRLSAAATPGPSSVSTEELAIPGEFGPIRARIYFRPGASLGPSLVIAHGVHYRGINESRLVAFSRALAESGLTVLTPELSEVADYRITESGVAVIRKSVSYLAQRQDQLRGGRVEGERVGLLGFSFAGGLSLVAAQDPETARKLSFVTSVGGHHDLRRVMRFLIHDEIATDSGVISQAAHDYGLVVLVHGNLERFVPEQDLFCMRAAFRAWLHEDRAAARAAADDRTTPEAEQLWELLETEQLQLLAPELDAVLASQAAQLEALSPAGKLGAIGVPVYLLHGTHDSVIPAYETNAAGLELHGHHRADHLALVSPLLEHVEVSRTAGWADQLALLSFMARLM